MERLETVVVLLEESKRFILSGRTPHLRLALILLDNAAELLMHRRLESDLYHDEFYAKLHRFIDQVDASPEEKDEERRKLGYTPLSNRRKWDLKRKFPEKAAFLSRDAQAIPKELADVLTHLHTYRNDAQHNDRVRVGSLRPAVLVLFDAVCELLVLIAFPSIYDSGLEYEWAKAYGINPLWPGDDACDRIAAQLRDGLPLDVREIAAALAAFVRYRLNTMMDGLAEISPGEASEDALKALQFWNEDRSRHPRDRGDLFHAFTPAHTMESVDRWRAKAHEVESVGEKLALFRAYAQIEREMEPLESLVQEVVVLVEVGSETMAEIDMGK